MGQKSKEYQEMDRAIGQWKQKLLNEAEDIINGDFANMKEELTETTTALGELHREAKRASVDAKLARESIRDDQASHRQNFILHTGLACFFGSLFGSFITFLLLWYFW